VTNKPKAIGTSGESGFVKAAQRLGFPGADRQPLRGNRDTGDAILVPGLTAGVIASVKAGAMAKNASLADIDGWWKATEVMRDRAGAKIGLLVVARRGYAPARAESWRCIFDAADVLEHPVSLRLEAPVAVVLAEMRRQGWGSPLEPVSGQPEAAGVAA
jgi:hypothetical protein